MLVAVIGLSFITTMDKCTNAFLRSQLKREDTSLLRTQGSASSKLILESRKNCVEKVLKHICSKDVNRLIVHGGLGSGKTSVVKEVMRSIMEKGKDFSATDILYFKVSQHSCIESVYQLFGDLAKEFDLREESTILASSDSIDEKRRHAIVNVTSMYKLICLEDVDSDGGNIWNVLKNVVQEETFLLATESAFPLPNVDLEEVSVIAIPMLTFEETLQLTQNFRQEAEKKSVFTEDSLIGRVYMASKGNPFCVMVLMNMFKNLSPATMKERLLSLSNEAESDPATENEAFLSTISFLLKHMSGLDKQLLYSVSHIRRPLPLAETDTERFTILVNVGLVSLAEIKEDKTISVACPGSVARAVQCLIGRRKSEPLSPCESIGAFHLWKSILCETLKDLLHGAETQEWAYVPEPW